MNMLKPKTKLKNILVEVFVSLSFQIYNKTPIHAIKQYIKATKIAIYKVFINGIVGYVIIVAIYYISN